MWRDLRCNGRGGFSTGFHYSCWAAESGQLHVPPFITPAVTLWIRGGHMGRNKHRLPTICCRLTTLFCSSISFVLFWLCSWQHDCWGWILCLLLDPINVRTEFRIHREISAQSEETLVKFQNMRKVGFTLFTFLLFLCRNSCWFEAVYLQSVFLRPEPFPVKNHMVLFGLMMQFQKRSDTKHLFYAFLKLNITFWIIEFVEFVFFPTG